MKIQLNGKGIDVPEEVVTLQDLIVWYGLQDRMLIAELNREIIKKESYQTTVLAEKDLLELIHFVGGG